MRCRCVRTGQHGGPTHRGQHGPWNFRHGGRSGRGARSGLLRRVGRNRIDEIRVRSVGAVRLYHLLGSLHQPQCIRLLRL